MDDNDNVRNALQLLLEYRGYEFFAFFKPIICPIQIHPICRCNKNQACKDVMPTDLDMQEMDVIRKIKLTGEYTQPIYRESNHE